MADPTGQWAGGEVVSGSGAIAALERGFAAAADIGANILFSRGGEFAGSQVLNNAAQVEVGGRGGR